MAWVSRFEFGIWSRSEVLRVTERIETGQPLLGAGQPLLGGSEVLRVTERIETRKRRWAGAIRPPPVQRSCASRSALKPLSLPASCRKRRWVQRSCASRSALKRLAAPAPGARHLILVQRSCASRSALKHDADRATRLDPAGGGSEVLRVTERIETPNPNRCRSPRRCWFSEVLRVTERIETCRGGA